MVGNIVKPEYIRDTFKLTRSPITILSPRQKLHISNKSKTVDQDIFVGEEQFGRIFQGHNTVYVTGMFDKQAGNFVIDQRLMNQGW